MSEFAGLMLISARTGVPWHWCGHDLVQTKRGKALRLELWQAPCRTCGDDFTAHGKLPGDLRQRFLERASRAREAGQAIDVRIVVPREVRIPAFELRNCKPCREALRLL